jgi:amino acid transporter
LRTAEAKNECVGVFQGVSLLGLDALSSASYGPEAALTILAPLGVVGLVYAQWIFAAILALLLVLYLSYRQTIAAYPNGGGAYTVASENLGRGAGLFAAAALLVDYLLNVAVGISAGIGALESAFPAVHAHLTLACLVMLAILAFANLRGVHDVGNAWLLPTYAFIVSLGAVVVIGLFKAQHGGGHPAPVIAPPALRAPAEAIGLWLILRGFASGCTAMTGVEAVSNAVPLFAKPAVRNARRALLVICAVLGFLLAGVIYLAHVYRIGALNQEKPGYESVLSQLTSAAIGRGWFYYVTIGSVLTILTLSANTSFAAFPRVCRLLAEDRYLPSAFATLGRRLVYTPGIVVLTVLSAALLLAFRGITARLIPLFAVGAFAAFTMSQAGMIVHWRREGRGFGSPALLVNAVGAFVTGVALSAIFTAKFLEGAWIVVLTVPALMLMFTRVRAHYDRLEREVACTEKIPRTGAQPLKIVVAVQKWNKPTDHAVRLAMRLSDDVTGVHVTIDEPDHDLETKWHEQVQRAAENSGAHAPKLEIVRSPYRTLLEPLLDFLLGLQKKHPGSLIGVVIPEIVEPRWWEYLLHNHAATALKSGLRLNGNDRIVVIDAPWHARE